MIPGQHRRQVLLPHPVSAVEHHVQHVRLVGGGGCFGGQFFPGGLDHDGHHQAIESPELFQVEVPLQGEQGDVAGDGRLAPDDVGLGPRPGHGHGADGPDPVFFRGGGITLDLARPDPAQIENFRPGGEGLICLDQGEGGQAGGLGQQGGIALGAAGVGGVENGVHFDRPFIFIE